MNCELMLTYDTPLFGKQEVGIWRVKKRFPRYEVPIWSLWPNIRFLPSIVCHIFLSNYWWQRSDIWSQASYRYPISWEAFLDPSNSYFLFADLLILYTFNIHLYMHILTKNGHIQNVCSMCIKINKVGKQEVGIWRFKNPSHNIAYLHVYTVHLVH
jgi:hypothetical protein